VSVVAEIRPGSPYSFELSRGWAGDATRRVRDGVLQAVVLADGEPELATGFQRPDGVVVVRAESEAGVERMRFVLGVDDDTSEFFRRFGDDPFLGGAVRGLRGLHQLRVSTVTQALLRALCGQLIDSKRARQLEARLVRTLTPEVADDLHAPPTASTFASLPPVRLRQLGLHARRAATLVRLCRSLDPERLHGLTSEAAAARIERERGLGAWSAGVVCLEGLGRHEIGLVGDLGLIKLMSALQGRWVDPRETEELLAPYGEWAGLASVFLLKGWGRGLLPLPPSSHELRPPARFRFATAS
jgi:3-methyladenine DNA glycosylase/8-oxoguanine DNA glycosylase